MKNMKEASLDFLDSVNCFLLDVPQSVREELQLKKDELMKKYKFNPNDGIKYNINTEPN